MSSKPIGFHVWETIGVPHVNPSAVSRLSVTSPSVPVGKWEMELAGHAVTVAAGLAGGVVVFTASRDPGWGWSRDASGYLLREFFDRTGEPLVLEEDYSRFLDSLSSSPYEELERECMRGFVLRCVADLLRTWPVVSVMGS
jgi:hypothetical protein